MLRPRLIVTLLVDAELHLVQTTGFSQRRYLGDPLNAAYVFSGYEVDELLVLDIDATSQKRTIPLRFVEALARFTRVPLTIGGGITSLDQIHDLLAAGVEKVALGSALQHDFSFLQRACQRFGSSTLSVLLNVHHPGGAEAQACFGRPDAASALHPLSQLALACEQAGAGELVLNFVARDGKRCGFDIPVLSALNDELSIPLVALGGCGAHAHIDRLLSATSLSGVAAGTLFSYAPETQEVLLNYPHSSTWLTQQLPILQASWR